MIDNRDMTIMFDSMDAVSAISYYGIGKVRPKDRRDLVTGINFLNSALRAYNLRENSMKNYSPIPFVDLKLSLIAEGFGYTEDGISQIKPKLLRMQKALVGLHQRSLNNADTKEARNFFQNLSYAAEAEHKKSHSVYTWGVGLAA